jgi:transglutaminase-like putative cysteine protease
LSCWVFSFASLFGATAFANDYVVAPAPNWVTPISPGKENAELLKQISDGEYFLLSEVQVRATADSKVAFRRYVAKAINTQGVEAIANIQIAFDPSYQRLTLHAIDVVRNGSTEHRLPTAAVRIVQREKDLDRQIYDGSKTATIFLEDVRVGDVIDYSFSLEGRNPVFNGLDSGTFALQYGVPVGRVHARLIVPSTKVLFITPRHTDLQPVVHDERGYREYAWDVLDIPEIRSEPDAPSWYEPYAVVQYSEFADWAAVAAWARPLYQVPSEPSPELLAEVDRIAHSEREPEGRMLAALQFVQTKIRYLGVEIGPGSHAPSSPSTVFARRFGDCKDKALLTLTLLRKLGIDAQAALVNTNLGRSLVDMHPVPTDFDHVLVHAVVGGKTYWIDPTRSNQAGDAAHLYQPDYDYALLVDAKTRALTSMKHDNSNRHIMHAVYDARSGFDKPVRYTMTSTVGGERAEAIRYWLASSNRDELQKNYLDYYAHYYAGIRVFAPLQIVDDAATNLITTTESYEIPDIATWSEKDKRHSVEIDAPDVDDLLRAPASTERTAPLKVKHPVDVVHTTDVLLPDDWSIQPKVSKVDDPAFVYERRLDNAGRHLTITDTYRSRVDSVAPADVVRYASNLAKARSIVGYELYWSDPSVAPPKGFFARINWSPMLVGLLALAGWLWLARRAWRYDPRPRAGRIHPALRGIRGWLLLPALGTIISPIILLVSLRDTFESMRLDIWTRLTSPDSPVYNALWAPTLLFELVANLGLFVFGILLAMLFAKRRSSVPTFYVSFLVASIVVQVADQLFAGLLDVGTADRAKDMAGLVRNCISAAIWSAYFLNSERVRSTFVEVRSAAATVPPELPEPAVV